MNKQIAFIFFCILGLLLIPSLVFASSSALPLTLEPIRSVYQTQYADTTLSDDNLTPAKDYYHQLKTKVDEVLKRKIKDKLYNEVFDKDILQEIYEDRVKG